MPDYGLICPHLERARVALEYCRFIYKMYAQTCMLPIDPFFEARSPGITVNPGNSARQRLMLNVHEDINTLSDRIKKIDPIPYHLNRTPNPSESTLYGDGTGEMYNLLQPRAVDTQIGAACGFDLGGNQVLGGALNPGVGADRCGYFQGSTGQIIGHANAGWPSYLGAVVRSGTTAWIVFRGSRSGSGGRALTNAQFRDIGNPDWITDMQWLKPAHPDFDQEINLASGFYFAYRSCIVSLQAAYNFANQNPPAEVVITGHSLGGALAQMAYLDLAMGTVRNHIALLPQAISCFPISAPPVSLGQRSNHLLSHRGGAAHIHHFFVPKDAVHAGPLVDPGVLSTANKGIKLFSHPFTSPYHLGSETALFHSTAAFPDAHEPVEVYKGMYAGQLDADFWITITRGLEHEITPTAHGLPHAQIPNWLDALENLAQPDPQGHDPFVLRAKQWLDAAKGKSNVRRTVTREVDRDAEGHLAAIEFEALVYELANAAGQGQDFNFNATRALWRQKCEKGALHRATTNAYITLLLGLGIHQNLRQAGRFVPAPTARIYDFNTRQALGAFQARPVGQAWPRI